MKYLFLSGLYPKEDERFFVENSKSGSLQNAPNVFQWNVVDGLFKNDIDFWVLSAPFVASFPRGFKSLMMPEFLLNYKDKAIGKTIRFCNLIGFKETSIARHLEKEIYSWINENSIGRHDKFVLLSYTPLAFFVNAIKRIKKKYPNVIACTIVTDLIEDAQNFKVNQNLLKRIQIAFEKVAERDNFKIIDKFVLLSKAMVERIPEANNRSIIVEGISNVYGDLPRVPKNSSIKSLLYTGSLHEFSGIRDLVLAFRKTNNENYRLIICGLGACESFIKKEAEQDTRIVFLGNLKREDALKEQYRATALINPRSPIEEITKYSFPSKTMEYLSSGTPMIGYHLPGIPEEYYSFFFSPKDLSVDELARTIDNVLSMDERLLREKGERAFIFIRDKKNSKEQVGKIISFLEK